MLSSFARVRRTVLISAILPVLLSNAGCSSLSSAAVETQLSGLYTEVVELRSTLAFVETIQSYQSTQIGHVDSAVVSQAPVATTAAVPERVITVTPSPTSDSPISGSVVIEDGICCAGGEAGETIEIGVSFNAFSTAGEVVEMRFTTGLMRVEENRLAQEAWIPLESEMTFKMRLAINWVGWWVSVQYRDSEGNISPIYYDDISLEGH